MISIPLMASSAVAHWLASESFFILVEEGGYFATHHAFTGITYDTPWASDPNKYLPQDPNLPYSTTITLTYASQPLIFLCALSAIVLVLPFLLSAQRVSGVFHAGNSSYAISAACHVSDRHNSPEPSEALQAQTPEAGVTPTADSDDEGSGEALLGDGEDQGEGWQSDKEYDATASRRKLAKSKLRWGEVKMSRAWQSHWEFSEPVHHLGFGTEGDYISAPVLGRWYA